jgi:hypothetical protein
LSVPNAPWPAAAPARNVFKISPHRGPRELYLRCAREKQTVPDPIVVYQLNWKGESLHRSNDIAAFVSSRANESRGPGWCWLVGSLSTRSA